ncbi:MULTISPECIES: hypothetical protein [Mycolicibacter]|uniref:Uncharacterized protein n=2 Tax=Mycolicibacter TaxID=1073531 RepID=A0ABU5XLF6_9MYCO|nr:MULTISPECIES: hypothetical protein [unclassified Mycolicibacter]MEB3023008.1 hypothetical protein [Mycolicibacter sp. MYC098]MEB3033518.1 hypothetical protein [Mycolicibacter sp. MYC340]
MTQDAAVLRDLERQVRDTIAERANLERGLAHPDALRSATARAYRDRDAVTSPLLEEARLKAADDIAEFHKRWRELDKIARNTARLKELLECAPPHVQEHRDAIVAELPAAREQRARIGHDVKAAGLESLLPEGYGGDGQG